MKFTLLKHVSLPVLVFFSWPRCVPPKQHAASRGTILFTLTWSIFIALGADVRYGWPSTCCLDVHEHLNTKKRKKCTISFCFCLFMFYQSRSDNLYSLKLSFVGSLWCEPHLCDQSHVLANVLTLTRPGIERGFLPLLLAVALVVSVGCSYCQWRVVQ